MLIFQCANRGTASGGPKDNTPPVVLNEVPKNFSTNFNANEIKIYFDEYDDALFEAPTQVGDSHNEDFLILPDSDSSISHRP